MSEPNDFEAWFASWRKQQQEEFEKSWIERCQQPNYDCVHPGIPEPVYDSEKAKGMDVYEVRKHFPRIDWCCDHCGACGVSYASFEHYIAGDW